MLPSLAWLSRPICLPPYFAGCTERSARWPCFIFANSQVSCTVINVHGGQRLPRPPVNNEKQGDTLALRREPVEHRAPGNAATETLNRSEKTAPLNRKAPRDRQLRKRSLMRRAHPVEAFGRDNIETIRMVRTWGPDHTSIRTWISYSRTCT